VERIMIKPIPTRYAGRLFRSRLEARFAVFFNALGIDWDYEPEGFALKAGWYLPDFYLPNLDGGTWIEVKPWGKGHYFGWGCGPALEDKRLDEFADLNERFFVAHGLPDPNNSSGWFGYESPGLLNAAWDPHYWCVCGCGKTVGLQFDGRGDRVKCPHKGCPSSSHGDKGYSFEHKRIMQAATEAHEADFR
jgi:hypothetical protein